MLNPKTVENLNPQISLPYFDEQLLTTWFFYASPLDFNFGFLKLEEKALFQTVPL